MAGNTFVEITQKQVIENQSHFFEKPEIRIRTNYHSPYFLVKLLEISDDEIVVVLRSSELIFYHHLNGVYESGDYIRFKKLPESETWITSIHGDEFIVYGMLPASIT
jgi:hypothetical protein